MISPARPLPDLLAVPKKLSPSLLGNWVRCRLKLVATSSRENRSLLTELPSGPAAAFGTVVHRALQAALVGESDPLARFEQELDRRIDELRRDPTSARYADLRVTVEPAKLAAARDLIQTKRRLPMKARRGVESSQPADRRIRGSEVLLDSEYLRLRGSADYIRQSRDAVEIVDFKTGEVTDDAGEPKRAYSLQLQAYALMVREREPGVRVLLTLDNGKPMPVPSDDSALEMAREEIERITSALPPGEVVPPAGLASPGPDCRTCSIRPSCVEYRNVAPSWWPDVPEETRSPLDTWGEVRDVQRTADGIRLILIDAAGRGVRIDQLDPLFGFDTDKVGQRFSFFELAAETNKRGFNGERPHPRLFRDGASRTTNRPAWRLVVLTEVGRPHE